MLMHGLSSLMKVAGKAAEALNKMDEKVVGTQKKENKSDKKEEPLGDLIMKM